MEQPVTESTNGADSIVEVRVGLAECVPEIWRVLELAGSLSLGEVHEVLQVAFGWDDVHLHRFTADDPFARLRPVDGEIPETPQWLPAEWCEEPEDLDEEHCTLEQLLAAGEGAAFYEYDFGDSWLHRLDLVAHRSRNDTDPPARLLAGAGRGPLEDSGGFPGYGQILDVIADPAHPDHANVAEWIAEVTGTQEPYDPAHLDIDAVRTALSDLTKAAR